MARGPTGWEVARAANVSQSTVSLVLSGRAEGRVSAQTQEVVRSVAAELGYRPHAAARSLRLGRSGLVLLVVPDVQNPFFVCVLDGAQRAAQENQCSVVLGSGEYGTVINDSVNAVDGVLVCSKQPPDLAVGLGQVPMVVMDAATLPGVPSIRLGVAAGMTAAVRRLRELGHRHLGYVRARPRTPTFLSRWHAFQRGTGDVRTTICTADLAVRDAERAALELLADPADRPTAVICDDDLQAGGVYRAAHQLGLGIPDDLSVVGFGNTPVSQLLVPDLTTVELSGEELGRTGLITLLEVIDGKQPAWRSLLPTTLLERGSTAPPPVG